MIKKKQELKPEELEKVRGGANGEGRLYFCRLCGKDQPLVHNCDYGSEENSNYLPIPDPKPVPVSQN